VTVAPDPRGEKFDIGFTLTERAYVTVDILDDQGRFLGTLVAKKQEPIGRRGYHWDGRRPGGDRLPGGRYTVRITAEPTYSSYHYFQKVVERGVKL
jgi:flagellar hook assembly protein FlgD